MGNAGFHSVAVNALDWRSGRRSDVELEPKNGAIGAVLREHPELAAAVADAVRDVLSAHLTPSEVVMPAGAWIVTGQNARPSRATHQNPPL